MQALYHYRLLVLTYDAMMYFLMAMTIALLASFLLYRLLNKKPKELKEKEEEIKLYIDKFNREHFFYYDEASGEQDKEKILEFIKKDKP